MAADQDEFLNLLNSLLNTDDTIRSNAQVHVSYPLTEIECVDYL